MAAAGQSRYWFYRHPDRPARPHPFWPGTADSAFALANSGPALTAELAVLASAVIYGFSIGLAKRSSPEVSTTVLTAWQVFYSGTFIIVASLIFEHGYLLQPTWTTFTALLYLVQNQQTYSGMNEHAQATSHIPFPKMFPDYALGSSFFSRHLKRLSCK